jgi:membrane associated rhomboid family serine protease
MDWSLVLLSQEIQSVIDRAEDDGWGLIVARPDADRALEHLRQYRIENFQWPWRQAIRPEVLFDWASLGWVAAICMVYWLDARRLDLRSAGFMDSAAVSRGEWWRLFTAMFLHADFGHLAANAGFGLVLLGLAMGVYGTGVGLLGAFLAGAGGNALTWVMDPGHRSLGASGMVMGCLGLLAAQAGSTFYGNRRPWKTMLGGLIVGLMLFLLLGSGPGTDLVAHAGGFLTGLLLGALMRLTPRIAHNAAANLFGAALSVFIAGLAWRRALGH